MKEFVNNDEIEFVSVEAVHNPRPERQQRLPVLRLAEDSRHVLELGVIARIKLMTPDGTKYRRASM